MRAVPSRAEIARERIQALLQPGDISETLDDAPREPRIQWRLTSLQVRVVLSVFGTLAVLIVAWSSAPRASVESAVGLEPSTAAEIVVDVVGKVGKPGVVTLPAGSRVQDAIAAAGGIQKSVDTSGLNLARVLVDGEQIVVGVSTTASNKRTLSLNNATAAELEALPGIGPVTASAIIEWRESNGGFHSVDDLLRVSGIGSKTLAELKPHLSL